MRAEDLAGDAGALDFGLFARALMAAAQKEADGDEACKQGCATLAHEGQRDARERDEAHDTARDEERLQGDGGGEAHRHEGGEVGACTGCREQAAHGKQDEQENDGGRAQKAHLLGDGGEDEVALHDGNHRGHSLTDACAHEVAVGNGVKRLGNLPARACGVAEWVEPDLHAGAHVGEELV